MLPVTGIIVAGGRGTRLGGRDKAFLQVDGEPIIARTLRVFRNLFPQTVVVTQHPERFERLGVEVTSDRYPGYGPLAGIHAGLLAAREPHGFVSACDMPRLDPDVIRFLIDRLPGTTPPTDAIVPCWDGDVEPLHAVYAVRSLPVVERCLERREHSVRDFLQHVQVDYVAESMLASLSGAVDSFTNVNTPEELERLRQRDARDAAAGVDGDRTRDARLASRASPDHS
jgi:molybdopterin-guanine dinucleotide biosynthesis protein A